MRQENKRLVYAGHVMVKFKDTLTLGKVTELALEEFKPNYEPVKGIERFKQRYGENWRQNLRGYKEN
ncbi:MAG: hypothetical protein ACTSXD_07030 [Candidatus Heimdallarchaeaceae archaeon]